MAEIFVLCGFFMVYFTEEMTHYLIHKFMAPTHQASVSPTVGDESQPALTSASGGGGGGHGHNHEDVALDFIDGDASTFEATLRGFLVILALRYEHFLGLFQATIIHRLLD